MSLARVPPLNHRRQRSDPRFRLPARPHTDYSSLSCAFEMLAADLRGPRHKPEWNMYICAADRVTVRTKAM